MTISKINMKRKNDLWCWSVTVNGLRGKKKKGSNIDYYIAYQDAFNFILDSEREGSKKSVNPVLCSFLVLLVFSLVIFWVIY